MSSQESPSSHKKFYDFRVEDWYNCCFDGNPLTFVTKFMPITIEQANAVVHLYEIFHKYPRQLIPELSNRTDLDEEKVNYYLKGAKVKLMKRFANCEPSNIVENFYLFESVSNEGSEVDLEHYEPNLRKQKIFTQKDATLIQQLALNLHETFESMPSDCEYRNNGYFVRASTRSPKDGCLKHRESFMEHLKQELVKNSQDSNRELTYNEPLAVVRTLNAKLCVQNAMQAMNLVIHSERMYADLFRALLFIDEKLKKTPECELPGQKFVARLFKKMKRPEYEFRVFVKYFEKEMKHQVTGITQYFRTCYLEDIQHGTLKEQIQKGIEELAQEVSKRLSTTENFVLDVSVEYDKNETGECTVSKIWMIEINSFSKQASPCMFDWNDPVSNEILMGNRPMEFRVLTKPLTLKEGREELAKDIREMLEEINGAVPPEAEESNDEDKKKNCSIQ